MVQLFMSERWADESTALHHLEQAEWDLKAAMPMYMPPEPPSPMVGRTLATSNFKKACGCTKFSLSVMMFFEVQCRPI